MNIDYGYALNGLINNRLDYYLVRAEDNEVTKKRISPIIRSYRLIWGGFLYREAGFLNREGNKNYIIGRIDKTNSLKEVISNHLKAIMKPMSKIQVDFLTYSII